MLVFFDKLDGEIMEDVGLKLRILRKSYKLSQMELSQKLAVSRKHIIDIEAGRGTSLLIFIKLLKLYNKSDKLLEILETSSISPKDRFIKAQK